MLRFLIKKISFAYGLKSIFLRFYKPSPSEYADFLRIHGRIHSMGKNVSIVPGTLIADPEYVSFGENILLASSTLIGHDGSIEILNKCYGVKLDAVGKIEILDNVFIGHNAIILRNVTIGPNAIVAAGSVVTKNVQENCIVGGVPARIIGKVDAFVEKLKIETSNLPWVDLIYAREGAYDSKIEPELIKKRIDYFFNSQNSK